jgi:hypothetical protein
MRAFPHIWMSLERLRLFYPVRMAEVYVYCEVYWQSAFFASRMYGRGESGRSESSLKCLQLRGPH